MLGPIEAIDRLISELKDMKKILLSLPDAIKEIKKINKNVEQTNRHIGETNKHIQHLSNQIEQFMKQG